MHKLSTFRGRVKFPTGGDIRLPREAGSVRDPCGRRPVCRRWTRCDSGTDSYSLDGRRGQARSHSYFASVSAQFHKQRQPVRKLVFSHAERRRRDSLRQGGSMIRTALVSGALASAALAFCVCFAADAWLCCGRIPASQPGRSPACRPGAAWRADCPRRCCHAVKSLTEVRDRFFAPNIPFLQSHAPFSLKRKRAFLR